MKYRKKPVVIDAVQFSAADKSTHMNVNYSHSDPDGQSVSSLDGKYWVQTLEGPLIVSEGDWIITDTKGEHYPCKPHIFPEIYEPA